MVTAHAWQDKVKLVLTNVGAVLYWLETHICIRDQTPCTSKENTWIDRTAVKDITYLILKDIDFTSAKKKLKYTHEGEGANN